VVRVSEVMSSPVVTVRPATRLKEVADLLVTHGISAVPVTDADGRLVGIVSEADLLRPGLAPDPRAHLTQTVDLPVEVPGVAAQVMTPEVVALPMDADLAEAARLMLERRIKSIPIVHGRQLVGVVARRDLLAVLARGDSEIATALEDLLAGELGPPSPYQVTVRDGVVELTGPHDPRSQRLAMVLARGVPGVVDVRLAEE
jgi:CBS domain-containing protein